MSLRENHSVVQIACKTSCKPWSWPTQPLQHCVLAAVAFLLLPSCVKFFPASGTLLLLGTLSLSIPASIYWSTSALLSLSSWECTWHFNRIWWHAYGWRSQECWNPLPTKSPRNSNTWQKTTVSFNRLVLGIPKEDFSEASWRRWVRLKKRGEVRCPDL